MGNRPDRAFEDGAVAVHDVDLPLLRQVYAQLVGIRLKVGKSQHYSALDDSIDRLKAIIREEI